MLRSIEWPDDRSFRSGQESEPIVFYIDALSNSNRLDLLLGYFSSSAINVLSLGFARFISNGGKLRLVINNILSKNDKEILIRSQNAETNSNLIDISDVKGLKSTLDEYGLYFFNCLTWLFARKIFDIKIIRPHSRNGISHYKSGIFYNGIDSVGFRASCNFTSYGLLENLEELDVFLSWENSRSTKWIISQQKYFNNLFEGESNFADYINPVDIEVALRTEFGLKEIDELIVDEISLVQKKIKLEKNAKVKQRMLLFEQQVVVDALKPRFPYDEGPRPYQVEAYEKWVKNGKQGIFAMATGTGKTITALNCVLEEALLNDPVIYRALILVPTIALLEQWEEELKKFNYLQIFKVSSRQQWKRELTTHISRGKFIPISFIVLATYDSFLNASFQKLLTLFPKDTILIADEGHHIGRPKVREALANISLNRRIALSATPKRYYDPEGTALLEKFFNDEEPYVYSFSMDRAILEGILCKYEYFPVIVSLTTDELNEYNKISKKIARFYSGDEASPESRSIVEKLLLKRKRIIHKAENKISATVTIVSRIIEHRGKIEYTLVYVPEGFDQRDFDSESEESVEETRLIDLYTRRIAEIDDSIKINQIMSVKDDRTELLTQFENGVINVLTSMKCLDEGIDIPRTETAIFCSSTGNPRQFIQRRGRVLRLHDKKAKATIFDLVVVPDIFSIDPASSTFDLERSLVKKELERVMYFASLSENFYHTEDVFKHVCEFYNLNIYTIYKDLQSI